MKLKKTHIGFIILGIGLLLSSFTELTSNPWNILTGNGYLIPKESSLFSFKATKMNTGSGDYWLYGKDNTFFYSTMINGINEPYIRISKEKANLKEGFDPFNYKTWSNEFLCGDLLETYAKKPKELQFIECETLENSQTIVRATYHVKGNQSEDVENFLNEHYGMGKLEWVCCGWETKGNYGSFEHPELTKINPNLSVTINMYASGEVTDENDPSKVRLETDRNKIENFTVIVDLTII